MRRAAFFVTLCLAATASAGTVKGRIQVVDKGGKKATDVSDVVVYVDGVKAKPKPARATVTMKGKSFLPRVVAVSVGGTVDFPNEDPIFHNVFSVSGENRFDLDLYKRPKSGSWTFQHPGIVRVYCNIHPQMSAVVVVRDNPYFTKASAEGSFVIEDVPAGKYELKAWQERAGEGSVEITVAASGETSAELTLDASTFKRVPHKNKFGKDYSGDEKY
jgi:plastocyanin